MKSTNADEEKRTGRRELKQELSREIRNHGGVKKIREELEDAVIRKERNVSMNGSVPTIDSRLRHQILELPKVIQEASGIVIYGRPVRSLIFTTDLAIIRNCDADAVFAVYPFTPQQVISQAIISVASVPVFCGIGGGTTNGIRTIGLARDVECQGAVGVVMNAPITNANLLAVSKAVDIPVVITVVSKETDIQARLDAGATILNVAAGAKTAEIVAGIRQKYPDVPIIATGGMKEESIRATINAGANAITWTPPATSELFHKIMEGYR